VIHSRIPFILLFSAYSLPFQSYKGILIFFSRQNWWFER
ncbi:MAG: hypothetical protein ACI8RD_009176, partial [Bacillariaceae sp.]